MIKKIDKDITLMHLSGTDSNIYLIGDTVIDTGTGFNFIRMRTLLKSLKKDFESVKQIVNTHGHFDHIGGNGFFPNAKILIHELDAPILEKGDEKAALTDFFDGRLHAKSVDQKLKEGEVLNIGSYAFKVIHTPGHSPGSICLHDEKNGILISGDTLFSDGVGRTDIPNANEEHLVDSLEKISKLKFKKLLPGHGEAVLNNADKVLDKLIKEGGEQEEV